MEATSSLATRPAPGLATRALPGADVIEQVIVKGDLARLSADERVAYYRAVCESVGLNPLTKPFEYITLQGKLTLYARRDATDQLRRIYGVSVEIVARERLDDVYVVTARATTADGRRDESTGVVTIGRATGDALANALMKAETKAKRRVTLSICGLGTLDETEVETIPDARPFREEGAPVAGTPAAALAPAERATLAPDWRDSFRAFLRGAGFGAEDYPAVCAVVAAQAERDIAQIGDIAQDEGRAFGQTLKGLARLLGSRGHDETAQARLVVWAFDAGRVDDLFASKDAANRVLYDWEDAQALAEPPPDPDGMFGPPAVKPRNHQDPA